MLKTRIATGLMLVLALTLVAAGDDHDHPAAAGPTDPRFEFLKSLAGSWTDPEGHDGHPTTYTFRVTAGGNAVEEREFVGSPMEMVTYYYMDGGELRATHYCMLGNRPELVAGKKVKKGSLDFACAGTPGGSASHDEHHVHAWSMKLDDEGRLHVSAQLVENGKPSETPTFVMTRNDQ